MSPLSVIAFIFAYFAVLLLVGFMTAKGADNEDFFVGNRNSKWYLVAFGMIGASLSGVTFISIPGWVAESQFSYMQVVLGYLLGYYIIATVLMPMYYRLNLTSIYSYLEQRFGFWSYKTGAFYFLISRIIGSAFRLFLVANVLQLSVFDPLGIPFSLTVAFTILLIWVYTFKGGIKTIVWTDTLQTLFMLTAVGVAIYSICDQLDFSFSEMIAAVDDSSYSKIFFFDDWRSDKFFFKQFFSGMFIAIVMTGLDQDMMQKNLSCKNLKEAQWNMFSFSSILIFVNFFFLSMGALLYLFASEKGIALPEKADDLFPILAMDGHLGYAVAVFFILGLIAAAYSSADSALTALTTSVCIDFLNIKSREKQHQAKIRKIAHVGMSLVIYSVILVFNLINDESVISALFMVAGYTYGPLLGMYSFGLFTRRNVKDAAVPWISLISPVLCYILHIHSQEWLNGYTFGFEILILNGLLTFIGLMIYSDSSKPAFILKRED